jgi:hypothetical protein
MNNFDKLMDCIVMLPMRYVGIPDEVKMGVFTTDLAAQMREAEALDLEIKIQLAKVGFS